VVETLQNFNFLAKVVHFLVSFPSKNELVKDLPFCYELESNDLTTAFAASFIYLAEGAFSNRV
jgi:hypothetical protein